MGLNTAATLWCSAAVGACAGADLAIEAVVLTAFVLAGNTLLRPLVNAINRSPVEESAIEAIYEVRVTVDAEHLEEARELLEGQLESANYPVGKMDVAERDEGTLEIVATLRGSTAVPEELNAVIAALEREQLIEHASWTLRTAE